MPVYNEQASVRKVIHEWFQELEDFTDNFVFLVLDDGSTDDTALIVGKLIDRLGGRLQLRQHENRGHGQTCLAGYREAVRMGAQWTLQIDSDGQCDPQFFFRFWRQREKMDAIYGLRKRRDDGFRRMVASFVLRWMILIFFRTRVPDANVPYRLYRTARLAKPVDLIPPGFDLANIALSYLLARDKAVRHGQVPIRFRERYGGEPKVSLERFASKAALLYRQLRDLPQSV